MRKWILKWLLGSDAKDYHEVIGIAVELRKHCETLLEDSKFLLERYKAICDEQNAFLGALKEAKNIPELMLDVIRILQKSRCGAKMDGGAEE